MKFDSELTVWQIVCKAFPSTNIEDIDEEGYAIKQSVSQICLKPEYYLKPINNNSRDDMVFTTVSCTSLTSR